MQARSEFDLHHLSLLKGLGKYWPHNKEEDFKDGTFFLMTTAINFEADGKQMTKGWPAIRENIKKAILALTPRRSIRIIHFVLANSKEEDPNWRDKLGSEVYTAYTKGFPKTELFMNNLGIALSPRNHILVDMANVITHAKSQNQMNPDYVGYDKKFLGGINHIYLGYHVFLENNTYTSPLLKFEKNGNMLKNCNLAAAQYISATDDRCG